MLVCKKLIKNKKMSETLQNRPETKMPTPEKAGFFLARALRSDWPVEQQAPNMDDGLMPSSGPEQQELTKSESWKLISSFNDKGAQYYELRQTFKDAESELPGFVSIRQRLNRVAQKLATFQNNLEPPTNEERDLLDERLALGTQFHEFGKLGEFYTLKIDNLESEHNKPILLKSNEPRAQQLLKYVLGAPIIANEVGEANDRLSMQPEAIRDRLAAKRFFNTDYIDKSNVKTFEIHASEGEELTVPVDIIVNLGKFDSFQGRGIKGSEQVNGTNGKITSFERIVDFATRETEPSAADEIRIFVQPNGFMFADNNSGDSHRIAAMIAKGDHEVRCKKISFIALPDNHRGDIIIGGKND